MLIGSSAPGGPLLASLPVPGRPLQPQLDIKHLLPFRLNGSSPLSLFPNFNTMDPVQKAVINHTFGVPQPLKKKQIISCNICHLRFNSTNQAEAHYKGHKHARKLKAMEAQKNRQKRAAEGLSTGRDRERDRDRGKTIAAETTLQMHMETSLETTNLQSDLEPVTLDIKMEESPKSSVMLTPESEASSVDLVTLSPPQISPSYQLSETASDTSAPEGQEVEDTMDPSSQGESSSTTEETQTDEENKKSKSHLHCPVCKVTVNSTSQLEAHNSGTKHKLMLEGQSVQPRRRGKVMSARAGCKSKRLGTKGSVGVPSKNYQCEVCEISVNSETQLSQHMNSRRHKDRLAGKPPKPKFTPHSKTQASSSLATKLALQKQLTKSLTTSGFLPSPLSPPPTLCTVATTNPLALRHSVGAAATTNPLALRQPMGTAAFIQTPFLSPALFRPAPGPLRATHTPIIFSPY
ncbi:zinc finger protein 385D isoform X2 [Periophthalmus magnuspinnatus]|uniref:zinc finger protein 385D isoform X2 n=1 Tax=Periophthalmus magnuspinnatus TaxID=409849 RepID=UPI002436D001|nr:zinc finger protein 385D isoform X2 [Periophthalmus magnuspinnatus]